MKCCIDYFKKCQNYITVMKFNFFKARYFFFYFIFCYIMQTLQNHLTRILLHGYAYNMNWEIRFLKMYAAFTDSPVFSLGITYKGTMFSFIRIMFELCSIILYFNRNCIMFSNHVFEKFESHLLFL